MFRCSTTFCCGVRCAYAYGGKCEQWLNDIYGSIVDQSAISFVRTTGAAAIFFFSFFSFAVFVSLFSLLFYLLFPFHLMCCNIVCLVGWLFDCPIGEYLSVTCFSHWYKRQLKLYCLAYWIVCWTMCIHCSFGIPQSPNTHGLQLFYRVQSVMLTKHTSMVYMRVQHTYDTYRQCRTENEEWMGMDEKAVNIWPKNERRFESLNIWVASSVHCIMGLHVFTQVYGTLNGAYFTHITTLSIAHTAYIYPVGASRNIFKNSTQTFPI